MKYTVDKYTTNNYDIEYVKRTYDIKLSIAIEFYRYKLYSEFMDYIVSLFDENKFILNEEPMKQKHLIKEIFAFYIYNNNSDYDIIFTLTPKYNVELINGMMNAYTGKNYDVSVFIDKIIDKHVECFHKLRKYDVESKDIYYAKCKQVEELTKNNKTLIYYLFYIDEAIDSDSESSDKLLEHKSFKIPYSTCLHLLRLYYLKKDNTYEIDTKDLMKYLSQSTINHMYILLYRYYSIGGGSTQASVLPSFKLLIKQKLNVKIELFASAINSSAMTYGSVFYDIEKYFGSIGSFFQLDIKAGYFEINPPFENNTMNEVFGRIHKFLENTDKGLLFITITPKRKLSDVPNLKKIKDSEYMKYHRFMKKDEFPYLHSNDEFSHSVVRAIVDTNIYIFHNEYIKPAIKEYVKSFNKLLDNFIKTSDK